MKEGAVGLAPFGDLVPQEVREHVNETKERIIDGELEVFPGMSDRELKTMYYLEDNVVGSIP